MDPYGIAAWMALQWAPGVGSVTIRRLVEHFGSAEAVWAAGAAALCELEWIHPRIRQGLARGPDRKSVEQGLEKLTTLGAWAMTYQDAAFPRLLKEIPDPPALLYGLGDRKCLSAPAVAIIGSRKASSYGRQAARRLSAQLARAHVTVVSGLAPGIDTAVHHGALDVEGCTVGVKGCGIDVLYPRQNAQLFRCIAQRGAIISEFPPGTAPEPKNFPVRNRIISGLSLGVVVVEASMRSGSLITASCALDQGREVMAVPGSVDSYTSGGTHWLIKQGARLVEDASDVLNELGLPPGDTPASASRTRTGKDVTTLEPEERRILSFLEHYPVHIDEIAGRSGMDISKVSGLLVQMELKNLVQALPGQTYQLK